jgi:hypothetical protein
VTGKRLFCTPPPRQQLMETVLYGHNATGRWVPWDSVDINDIHFKHICRCFIYILSDFYQTSSRYLHQIICLSNPSFHFYLEIISFFFHGPLYIVYSGTVRFLTNVMGSSVNSEVDTTYSNNLHENPNLPYIMVYWLSTLFCMLCVSV